MIVGINQKNQKRKNVNLARKRKLVNVTKLKRSATKHNAHRIVHVIILK
jgi:hypothetical protein